MSLTYAVGSLVKARGREWVVQPGSEEDFLILQPLGGRREDVTGLHTALERVESATFPLPTTDDLGDARSARLLRTALRLGFRSTAGPFRSIGSLSVQPRAYQFVPLMIALQQSPVRLLIADDVGVGKTVEAGLVAAELMAQGDVERLTVLCGPALAEQWQRELQEKFNLDAALVLTSTAARLERGLMMDESIFDRHPVTVVSTDFIKSPRRRDEFLTKAPELVIVDEAHTAVMDSEVTGRGRHQRHELLRGLADDPSRHLLLVTATPHSGKEEGFRNLIALLDPALAHLDLETVAGRTHLARHMVQRRRKDIGDYVADDLTETTFFPEDRLTRDVPYKLTPHYRDLFDAALAYARDQVRDDSGGILHQRVRWWSALGLLRALASSPAAAAETMRSRAATGAEEDVAAIDALGRASVLDTFDDEAVEGVDVTPGAEPAKDERGAPSERARLRALARQADALAGPAHDAKLALLVRQVKDLLADGLDPIVFCRFIHTADYVAEHLRAALGRNTDVAAVTGLLPPSERVERVAELTAYPDRRHVLVATDCLSEGVNLQEHFQAVVHYDLAWNPTRHEQREGRVDRFGQTAPQVKALTIYGQDNQIDGIVLNVLIQRHRAISKATGVSVPVPDQNDSVLEALLEGLLLRGQSPEQLTLDLGFTQARDSLHAAWESAAEREKRIRTKYQHEGLRPDAVAREVRQMRAALGSEVEIAPFVRESLLALGGQPVTTPEGLAIDTRALAPSLRDALPDGVREPLTFLPDLPVRRGFAALVRTDPVVSAVARHVLEAALDPAVRDAERPARRAGVIRTEAVAQRTTLLVLRYRFHLDLPSRRRGIRRVVAEDCEVVAFAGSPSNARWLSDEHAHALLDAASVANVAPDQQSAAVAGILAGLGELTEELTTRADVRARQLAESHARVRQGAGEVVRALRVRAEHPVDVLGVYVHLPVAKGILA